MILFGLKTQMFSKLLKLFVSKSVLYRARETHWHMYKPMKICTVYSRRVDVLLYILQSMISRIQGNVITFLRTLWIWHCLSFGQHWTVVGAPRTTHSPLHSTFWPMPTCLDTKCGKRVVPTVTTSHPLDGYCPTDGPAREAIRLLWGEAEKKF